MKSAFCKTSFEILMIQYDNCQMHLEMTWKINGTRKKNAALEVLEQKIDSVFIERYRFRSALDMNVIFRKISSRSPRIIVCVRKFFHAINKN